jgi:putative ABC transport system permease protein
VWESRGIDESIDARFLAAADAADVRSNTQIFEAFATYRCGDWNLNAGGTVQPVLGCSVSANFFDVLGVAPASGRAFSVAEEQAGVDQVAVISYGFWQRRRFSGN